MNTQQFSLGCFSCCCWFRNKFMCFVDGVCHILVDVLGGENDNEDDGDNKQFIFSARSAIENVINFFFCFLSWIVFLFVAWRETDFNRTTKLQSI